MNIFTTLKGIATELLDLPVPVHHVPMQVTGQSIDHNGYSVYDITASNYAEALSKAEGYTVAGPVYQSLVHVGRDKWQLRVECNDTEVRRR